MSACADTSADTRPAPEALAPQAQTQDQDATAGERLFRAFYEDHFDLVYALISRYGVAGGDVEDLAQQVFLVVHGRRAELSRLESPRAWLRAIVVRVVQAHYRWWRVRRAHAWLVLQSWGARSTDERTPEHAALSGEASCEVRRVLERMSTKLRDALVLVELEELSPREAAEVLGIPLNTLRSRVGLARRQFERLFTAFERKREGRR